MRKSFCYEHFSYIIYYQKLLIFLRILMKTSLNPPYHINPSLYVLLHFVLIVTRYPPSVQIIKKIQGSFIFINKYFFLFYQYFQFLCSMVQIFHFFFAVFHYFKKCGSNFEVKLLLYPITIPIELKLKIYINNYTNVCL